MASRLVVKKMEHTSPLRCQEPLQPPDPSQLVDLLGDPHRCRTRMVHSPTRLGDAVLALAPDMRKLAALNSIGITGVNVFGLYPRRRRPRSTLACAERRHP